MGADFPDKDTIIDIPVEDLYDGDKYDFSQMNEEDIFNLLEYVCFSVLENDIVLFSFKIIVQRFNR